MKQVLQNLKSGEILLEDLPSPALPAGHVLISTTRSLVSTGTERMLVEFGRGNLFSKALQQRERVKDVLEKMSTDGVIATINAVQAKLDSPMALGYSNVGVIAETADRTTGFKKGDRVVSNGPHAQIVAVPKHLVAKIPDSVTDDQASFTVLGAIALQGVRLIQPTLGECVVVTGLGLVGLLAVQILLANGCRVLGLDFDQERVELAASLGIRAVNLAIAQDVNAVAMDFSRGRGVDAVLIAATTTSNEPIRQAAAMSRKRGRIVLVGVVGTALNRADFYEKEITFQVSCSYGPGRYDQDYEVGGQDYPYAFVRWTEQRNFEAFLDLLAAGRVLVDPLVSHRIAFEEAERAYDLIANENPLAILFTYPAVKQERKQSLIPIVDNANTKPVSDVRVGVVGSGSFAMQNLIPALKRTGASLVEICSKTGVSGRHAAKRFGFEKVSSDYMETVNSEDLNSVVVATPHNLRADLICAALDAGKHVFVEKPLAIDHEQLQRIVACQNRHKDLQLTVGFNRRFSALTKCVKSQLLENRPTSYVYTVNAGPLAASHWVQDPNVGGGRVIGELCHFIDLLVYLEGSSVLEWEAIATPPVAHPSDNISVLLKFETGSIGSINYFSSGNKSYPKERVEIFRDGSILTIDNFRRLRSFGWKGISSRRFGRQDKGHEACVQSFVDAVRHGANNPVPFSESLAISLLCLQIADTLDG